MGEYETKISGNINYYEEVIEKLNTKFFEKEKEINTFIEENKNLFKQIEDITKTNHKTSLQVQEFTNENGQLLHKIELLENEI